VGNHLEFLGRFVGSSLGSTDGSLLIDEATGVGVWARDLGAFKIAPRGGETLVSLSLLSSPVLQLRTLNPCQQSGSSAHALIESSGKGLARLDDLPSKFCDRIDALNICLVAHRGSIVG